MTEPIAFVDGALVPRAEARVPIDDAAVRYGAACFETMRASHGRVFRLSAHLDRLRDGLRAMGVTPPTAAELEAAVAATLEANGLSEARVRLSVSAGQMPGPNLDAEGDPVVVVVADPVSEQPAPPLALAVSEVRIHAGRALARAKTAQYLPYLLARAEARGQGADDALLLNDRGAICETATANLFLVRDGGLSTPATDEGPLPGVTRAVILEIAAREGIPADERSVALEELVGADEVFVTNSIIGAQPVVTLVDGGRTLWTASGPAPVTERLADQYAQLQREETGGEARDG